MKRVFVHRYKWSHERRRRQLRKALKKGKATVVWEKQDGWLYEVPEDFLVVETR